MDIPVAPRKLRLGTYSVLCRPWNRERWFGKGQYLTSGGGDPKQAVVVLESFRLWPFEVTWEPHRQEN